MIYQGKDKIRQVFKDGDNYRLKCLNPIYADKTEYVAVSEVETYTIVNL